MYEMSSVYPWRNISSNCCPLILTTLKIKAFLTCRMKILKYRVQWVHFIKCCKVQFQVFLYLLEFKDSDYVSFTINISKKKKK